MTMNELSNIDGLMFKIFNLLIFSFVKSIYKKRKSHLIVYFQQILKC